MATGKDVLALAIKDIGITENPPNSNNVKFNDWYYGHSVYGSGYAWCLCAVQYWYAKAGAKLPFTTASCGALLRWYNSHQPECIVKNPQPGDIVIFDLPNTSSKTDHTGIFERLDGDYVTTVDGNTGTTNDANGGAVMRRTRNVKYVAAYIHPKEISEEDDMDIDKFIDSITSEQIERLVDKASNETCYTMLLKANEHAAGLATPDWMKPELDEAIKAGITDGTRPLAMCMRGAAAMMTLRAMKSHE